MARPTKLTPELQEAIVADVLLGHYVTVVARAHRIHPDTFFHWMERGRTGADGDEIYTEFSDAVAQAQAEAEISLGNTALEGDGPGTSNGPSKSAMTWLERTRATRFAPRVNVKVEEEMSVYLDVAAAVLPSEWYAKLMGALSDLDDGGLPRVLSAVATPDEGAQTTH